MVSKFGIEWHDRPEFYKLNGDIQKNSMKLKRNVPSFADIDINLYTATLETLLYIVNVDIYTDTIPDSAEVQKLIKERIFATTQLDKMRGTLDFLKNKYVKRNITGN